MKHRHKDSNFSANLEARSESTFVFKPCEEFKLKEAAIKSGCLKCVAAFRDGGEKVKGREGRAEQGC